MYRFGQCELDVAARELRRAGAPVHLEPQAFDLLAHLLEHRDRVVSKIELLDGVWGHRFVSEANLTTRVKEVRRAVGDDGTRQAVIRNVRGRGYRFVAAVEAGATGAPGIHARLIGRSGEMRAIVDLLERTPLVTILGPGGVGKSTLAREVVTDSGGVYADGHHVVELAALDAESDVALAVARAFDVVMDRGRPDDAVRSIARRHALLVLDNCEHVVDEVAALVDRLLAADEVRIQIVVTSQVRLGLSAEAVVTVEPLAIVDASALFVERARAVDARWDLPAAGRDRLDRLVSRLDGLPLTIEMAAARVGSMSFEDLEAAIDDDSTLLRLSHRAPARRHRSLGSVVAWSTDLLDDEQRQLFRAFSVFAGRVSATDAGAVVAPDDPAGARFDLASLAERSLLVADIDSTETRYSMLVTMRAAAARELDESGSGYAVCRRHAEHVLDVLRDVDDRLRTPAEEEGRRRLAGVVDEVRAAFRWASNHDSQLASNIGGALYHASYSTIWLEPAEWCRALLPGALDGLEGAAVLSAGAAVHRRELDTARDWADAVAATATGRLRAIAEELRGETALYRGDADAGLRAAEGLERLGHELGDPHFLAFAAVDRTFARCFAGDPVRALDDLDGSDLPPLAPSDAAWVALTRGSALGLAGEAECVAEFRTAIELGATVGGRHVVSVASLNLAIALTKLGQHGDALEAFAVTIGDMLRYANYTDGYTMLRGVVDLLAAIGDDRGATVVAVTTLGDELPEPEYQAGRVAGLLTEIRDRVGDARFAAWSEEGRGLAIDDALLRAAALVDQHRR